MWILYWQSWLIKFLPSLQSQALILTPPCPLFVKSWLKKVTEQMQIKKKKKQTKENTQKFGKGFLYCFTPTKHSFTLGRVKGCHLLCTYSKEHMLLLKGTIMLPSWAKSEVLVWFYFHYNRQKLPLVSALIKGWIRWGQNVLFATHCYRSAFQKVPQTTELLWLRGRTNCCGRGQEKI